MRGALFIALLIFLSCSPKTKTGEPNPLDRTQWTLAQYEDSVGTASVVTYPHGKAGKGYWIEFRGDTVYGADNCNSFSGRYTLANSSIQIHDLLSTLRGCPEILDLIPALSTAQRIEVDDVALRIYTRHPKLRVLVFEKLK